MRELSGISKGPMRVVVAWSGGLDSTVLLHAMLQARRSHKSVLHVRAVHVDHGLQMAAAEFRGFCIKLAKRWRVPLQLLRIQVPRRPGDSPEAAARDARYAALRDALRPGELLLTAQHADDQLESLLLALLRGAGPAGLAAMPAAARLRGAPLLRPLLQLERRELSAYAIAHALEWVEDPTNRELRFDRNYLREQVLPSLRQRWPAAARTALRSARHSAAAQSALTAVARRDLAAAVDGADLEVAVLRRWSAPRRAAVLRLWLQQAGVRAPNERHIDQIEAMLAARRDAHPMLRLPDGVVRRSGGRLSVAAT